MLLVRLVCLLVVLGVGALPVTAQDAPRNTSGGPLDPRQAAYDVTYYDLDLAIDPAAEAIEGTLAVHAAVTDSLDVLVLDLDTKLEARAAFDLGGDLLAAEPIALGLQRDAGQVLIHLGRTLVPGDSLVVQVAYGGQPHVAERPPWQGGFTWAETEDGQPWVAVSCQGEGADMWWPVKDHPSDEPDSMRIALTVPEGLVAASNGRLRHTTETEAEGNPQAGPATRTFEWFVSTPINNYTVTAYVAPFRVLSDTYESVTGETIPITFYVLPERAADGEAILPFFKDDLRFFEEVFGPYPFRADKYGIGHTPYLGMEHQTMISYGSTFEPNAFGFDWLHNHELAHEWWGNLVTARDWNDFWIHEGFGTYAQALTAERHGGLDAYRRYLLQSRRLLNNRRPVAPRESRTTKQMYFADDGASDGDIYYKGAWVLHTLRWLLREESVDGEADDVFFRTLRRMAYPDPAMEAVTDGSHTRITDTDELLAIAERVTGRDLDGFFEVYLRRAGLPRLQTQRVSRGRDRGLALRWVLPDGPLPDGMTFEVPVEVVVNSQATRVAMPGGEAFLPMGGEVEAEIDPSMWLLMGEMIEG
ncbi:MAG: M1 family metallopeptidase [Bacteroidota bacterium]